MCWLWSLEVSAQSTSYPPEPVDYDHAAEVNSVFWEKAAHPDKPLYRQRVTLAIDYLKRFDKASVNVAQATLQSAIELMPDEPFAHWVLAVLYERKEEWRACADAYARVHQIDANYTPPHSKLLIKGRKTANALDLGLAACLSQIHDFERALAHYKRVLSRDVSNNARVHRRLGEMYMALGRLHEAIDALRVAYKLSPSDRYTNYSLAVAYDRDEQEASANTALSVATRGDLISAIDSPFNWFTPAADRYYYKGLAYKYRGRNKWALAYFRQYIALTGQGPWIPRAREHLHDLLSELARAQPEFSIRGGNMKKNDVVRAIDKHYGALASCLQSTPGLLLQVSITVLGKRTRRARSRRQPVRLSRRARASPGIRAKKMYSFSTTEKNAASAIQCVETAAENIDIKRPNEGANSYRTVSFLVIVPPTLAETAN